MINLLKNRVFRLSVIVSVAFLLVACGAFTYLQTIGTLDPANFNSPIGIVTDSQGNIYVSDMGNNLIKKYDSQGRLILTFGGYGSEHGQLNLPADIAIDENDNVYVPELGNKRIQKFSSEGEPLAVFGEGIFDSTRSLAIADNGDIYSMDEFNHRVVQLTSTGDFVRTWGSFGIQAGQFFFPNSITTADGFVFVSDSGNARIQKFDLQGNFIAMAGGAGYNDNQFLAPRGIMAYEGCLYVSDSGMHKIKRYDYDLNFIDTIGQYGVLNIPNQVAVAADGRLVVINTGSHQLSFLSADNSIVTNTVGSGRVADGEINGASGLAVKGTELYVVNGGSHKIQVFDTLTGDYLRSFGTMGFGDAGLFNPKGIAIAYDGTIYVADQFNSQIKVFNSHGELIEAYSEAVSSDDDDQYGFMVASADSESAPEPTEIDWPDNMARAGYGDVMFSVKPSDGTGGFGLPGKISMPYDVKLDMFGNIYVVNTSSSHIQKFDRNFNLLLEIGTPGYDPGQLLMPTRMAIDIMGNMYVCDYGNHRVQKFDSQGNLITVIGSFGQEEGKLIYPNSIYIDNYNRLLVGESGNMRLSVFDLDGNFIRTMGSIGAGEEEFFFPNAITQDAYGNVYVSNYYLNTVKQIQIASETQTITQSMIPYYLRQYIPEESLTQIPLY